MVRQALSELQYEGVLDRVKGRGTFVAPQLTSQSLVQSLTGLHADVLAMGRTLRSDVRALKVIAADPDVAARLEIPVGTAVVLIERLRFVDGEPWVYAVSHVPAALAPDLVDQDLSEQSLYALLERRYGLRLRPQPTGGRGACPERPPGARPRHPAARSGPQADQRQLRRRQPARRDLRGLPPG